LLYLKDYVEYNKDDKNVAFEWLGFELPTKKNTIKSYSDLIFFKEDRNKLPFCGTNWPNEPNTANKANLNSNPISIPKWNGDHSGIMIEGIPYEDYLIQNMGKSPEEVPKFVEIYKKKNSWVYELPESFTTEEALDIAEKSECAKNNTKRAYVDKSYVEKTLRQCGFNLSPFLTGKESMALPSVLSRLR